MSSGLVILGTDTCVGKTHVADGLVRGLRDTDGRLGRSSPETGFSSSRFEEDGSVVVGSDTI